MKSKIFRIIRFYLRLDQPPRCDWEQKSFSSSFKKNSLSLSFIFSRTLIDHSQNSPKALFIFSQFPLNSTFFVLVSQIFHIKNIFYFFNQMNEDVSKSFHCREHNCDSVFYTEQSLASHQQAKHNKLNLEIPSKVFRKLWKKN